MIQLMTVPARLMADVMSGAAYVSGALVKDGATHQVLAHLQPTRLLSQAISVSASGALAPLQVLSDVAQNVQLLQIKSMLDTLQTVASIGAVSSVLNLGVSIGGFALVLSALKKVDGKLDDIADTVRAIDRKADAKFYADCITVLRRAEGGFELPRADRRQRWLETEDRIDALIEHTVQRLAVAGLSLEQAREPGTEAELWLQLIRPEQLQMTTALFDLVSARNEALLCLGRPAEAAGLTRRSTDWLSRMPVDPKGLAIARLGGRPVGSEQMAKVVRDSHALTTWVSSSRGAAQERNEVFDLLGGLGVDTEDYVLRVRDHARPELLLLPHQPGLYADAVA
jgi:hypothetical protein